MSHRSEHEQRADEGGPLRGAAEDESLRGVAGNH